MTKEAKETLIWMPPGWGPYPYPEMSNEHWRWWRHDDWGAFGVHDEVIELRNYDGANRVKFPVDAIRAALGSTTYNEALTKQQKADREVIVMLETDIKAQNRTIEGLRADLHASTVAGEQARVELLELKQKLGLAEGRSETNSPAPHRHADQGAAESPAATKPGEGVSEEELQNWGKTALRQCGISPQNITRLVAEVRRLWSEVRQYSNSDDDLRARIAELEQEAVAQSERKVALKKCPDKAHDRVAELECELERKEVSDPLRPEQRRKKCQTRETTTQTPTPATTTDLSTNTISTPAIAAPTQTGLSTPARPSTDQGPDKDPERLCKAKVAELERERDDVKKRMGELAMLVNRNHDCCETYRIAMEKAVVAFLKINGVAGTSRARAAACHDIALVARGEIAKLVGAVDPNSEVSQSRGMVRDEEGTMPGPDDAAPTTCEKWRLDQARTELSNLMHYAKRAVAAIDTARGGVVHAERRRKA